MCQAAGKAFYDYRRLDTTKEFLKELGGVPQICGTPLIVIKQGGIAAEQGTWIHPDAAVHFGQWLSPKFAVQVSKWVRDMSGKAPVAVLDLHDPKVLRNLLRRQLDEFEAASQPLLPAGRHQGNSQGAGGSL
ncbi:MAG: KilA-N domain-containing protein [Verrucomicrobiota bacterium]